MATSPLTLDLFDQWTATATDSHTTAATKATLEPVSPAPAPAPATRSKFTPELAEEVPQTPGQTHATPANLRRAIQELLKHGWLEQQSKPQLFRHLATQLERANALLEPLDLQVRMDDTRGLAYVAIAADYQAEDGQEDEWTHPLVRRQRLTLEQSLLLAILRREFLQQEQERGIGVPVSIGVEQLLPQLEIYLGASGSDMQDRKRLLALLDNLRTHGVVSEVDAQERLFIRPMIVHLANPQNLQALLQHLRHVTRQQEGSHDAT